MKRVITCAALSLAFLSSCTTTGQLSGSGLAALGCVLQAEGGTSVSNTPPSTIFPPNSPKQVPLSVHGSKSIPGPAQTIELRGWLTRVDMSCNGVDPDWHYNLAIDPKWAIDHLGIDITQLILPGNINEFSDDLVPTNTEITSGATTPDGRTISWAMVGRPTIHVELNGWRPSDHPGKTPPSDWGWSNSNGCPGVVWAFNPINPLACAAPLRVGMYVRIVGSLITDEPHDQSAGVPTWWVNSFGESAPGEQGQAGPDALNALQLDWAGGLNSYDANNPARWSEIHPPDIIADIDTSSPIMPTETFEGVTVMSKNCIGGYPGASCTPTTLDVDIAPPSNMPVGHNGVNCTEIVSRFTNFRTIIDGNNGSSNNSGAKITFFSDHVHVHVTVQGQTAWGAMGKFVAFYRVSWK